MSAIDPGASCRSDRMEPNLGRMPNDESPLRVAQPERHLTVPRDWVQKWEARQGELYALFAGCALSAEFVEGVVARALHQETAAYLAAYRVELPMWRRSLGI